MRLGVRVRVWDPLCGGIGFEGVKKGGGRKEKSGEEEDWILDDEIGGWGG